MESILFGKFAYKINQILTLFDFLSFYRSLFYHFIYHFRDEKTYFYFLKLIFMYISIKDLFFSRMYR